MLTAFLFITNENGCKVKDVTKCIRLLTALEPDESVMIIAELIRDLTTLRGRELEEVDLRDKIAALYRLKDFLTATKN